MAVSMESLSLGRVKPGRLKELSARIPGFTVPVKGEGEKIPYAFARMTLKNDIGVFSVIVQVCRNEARRFSTSFRRPRMKEWRLVNVCHIDPFSFGTLP
jgi:hypothetical protein